EVSAKGGYDESKCGLCGMFDGLGGYPHPVLPTLCSVTQTLHWRFARWLGKCWIDSIGYICCYSGDRGRVGGTLVRSCNTLARGKNGCTGGRDCRNDVIRRTGSSSRRHNGIEQYPDTRPTASLGQRAVFDPREGGHLRDYEPHLRCFLVHVTGGSAARITGRP